MDWVRWPLGRVGYHAPMDCRRQGHVVYHTRFHVVFATKYRRKVLRGGVGESLKVKLREVSGYYPDLEILEVNSYADHVHVLVWIPPKGFELCGQNYQSEYRSGFAEIISISAKTVCGCSGSLVRRAFVSTVGIHESMLRKYQVY